jgi:O-antigen/teichoic acid export membrane protein
MMRAALTDLPRHARLGFAGNSMLRNSTYLMANTVVTSLVGYAFWLVVARTSAPEVSGAGAASTSALQATALLACVGAATAMVERLPRVDSPEQWRRTLSAGLAVTVATAILGAGLVVIIFGHALGTMPTLRTPVGAFVFGLGAVLFTAGILLDHVAIAECRGSLVLARNTFFVALRIPLLFLPILVWRTQTEILTAWTIAAGLSLPLTALALGKRGATAIRPSLRQLVADVRELAGSMIGQHLITVAASMTAYVLPILVVARVSEAAAAYFYATWMLGAIFFMISPSVSTSLFAEAVADPDTIRALVRRAGRITGTLLAPPMIVYLVAGDALLRLFGPAYAEHGRWLIILLTLSAIPDAVTNIAVAVLRSRGGLGAALWLNVTMLTVCLALSWILLPAMGIVAVGVAWLTGQSCGAAGVILCWRRIVPAPSNGA